MTMTAKGSITGFSGEYRTMKVAGEIKVLFIAGFGPIVRETATFSAVVTRQLPSRRQTHLNYISREATAFCPEGHPPNKGRYFKFSRKNLTIS
jgi:hypothetical protein